MKTLVVRIDRRTARHAEVLAELASIAESVPALSCETTYDENAPDQGKYRDFIEVSRVSHADDRVLEWVAEELVDTFGWIVDVGFA